VSVHTHTPFRMVAAAMLEHDVVALPVLDALGHPTGVVSRTDLPAKYAGLGHGTLGSPWEPLTVRGRRTANASAGTTAVWLV
jgi:CBS-domain-containing membrane protein